MRPPSPTAGYAMLSRDRLKPGSGRIHSLLFGVTTDAFPAKAGPTFEFTLV